MALEEMLLRALELGFRPELYYGSVYTGWSCWLRRYDHQGRTTAIFKVEDRPTPGEAVGEALRQAEETTGGRIPG